MRTRLTSSGCCLLHDHPTEEDYEKTIRERVWHTLFEHAMWIWRNERGPCSFELDHRRSSSSTLWSSWRCALTGQLSHTNQLVAARKVFRGILPCAFVVFLPIGMHKTRCDPSSGSKILMLFYFWIHAPSCTTFWLRIAIAMCRIGHRSVFLESEVWSCSRATEEIAQSDPESCTEGFMRTFTIVCSWRW